MAEQVRSVWIARLQTLLACVLVIYLAWCGAQLIWWAVERESALVLTLPAQQQLTGSVQQGDTVRPVARYHLFGKEGVRKAEKPVAVTEAPKTRLRLVLKGVFTAEQGGESGAIVEEVGRQADYYRIGDTLPGNATLEAVYDDRILLRRNGRLETLPFEDGQGGQSSRIAVAEPSRTRQPAPIATPEQFLQEATEQLAANPEVALRSVGLAQHPGGGYVYRGNNPMLAGLNLKRGDVIRSVNGHTLGDVQKDRELMKTLYEQGSLEVEVVRDGASFYVNYPLR